MVAAASLLPHMACASVEKNKALCAITTVACSAYYHLPQRPGVLD